MNKYVIAKGYYGMGGSLAVVVCASRLAETLGRTLLIDWIDGYYGLKDEDIFRRLFSAPAYSLDRDSLRDVKVWPEFWQAYIARTRPYSSSYPLSRVTTEMIAGDEAAALASDVIVVSRDDTYWHSADHHQEMALLAQRIVPSQHLLEKINRFHQQYLGSGALGVHFRHGNGEKTVVPPDINWFFDRVDEQSKGCDDSKILLCTDCSEVINRFEVRYPGRIVYAAKTYPTLGAGSMHSVSGDKERLNSAEEAVVDIWLLSKCRSLIGSKSFFTGFAAKLNPELGANVKTWVPEFRSYTSQPGRTPIHQNEGLNRMFADGGVHTDGVFLESPAEGGYSKLYYLYWEVATFFRASDLDLAEVREKIASRRLY